MVYPDTRFHRLRQSTLSKDPNCLFWIPSVGTNPLLARPEPLKEFSNLEEFETDSSFLLQTLHEITSPFLSVNLQAQPGY